MVNIGLNIPVTNLAFSSGARTGLLKFGLLIKENSLFVNNLIVLVVNSNVQKIAVLNY